MVPEVIQPLGAQGQMPDGTTYFDFSSLVATKGPTGASALLPSQATLPGTLQFFDPNGVSFTYDLVFYGQLNHAPRITSAPPVTILAGQVYQYHVSAIDRDGDPVWSKNSNDAHAG